MENARIEPGKNDIDSKTIGFVIAPRINAAGRLAHADLALDLVTTQDFAEAISLSNELENINRRRQDMTKRLVSEAKEKADLISDRELIVVSDKDWPQGLVGLAAGRLADIYHKPVIVLAESEFEATGSARSSGNFDIVAALQYTEQYLIRYGGHKQAAGLTVAVDNIEPMYQALLSYARTTELTHSEPALLIDSYLDEIDLHIGMVDELKRLEPHGQSNEDPYFVIRRASVLSFHLVGATKKHVQLKITVGETTLGCIGFNMAYLEPLLVPGNMVDLAGQLIADSWNGTKQLKFKLKDVKIHGTE